MTNKEIGFKKIQELVTRFTEQLTAYKKSDYNETQTRRDFIDPFFKALGWDIDNEQGFAESYREVIHEDRVKVGTATKAPDYSFRLSGGQRLFFVEAKKPSVLIKDDIQPAYQVRRYGWNAKLNVSVITDFEEFAIYDCTKKPNPTDKTSVARVKYINYNDYISEWDFLWNTFSKEAVLKGSFDKFIGGNANKKGTATVDKEFLNSLDQWRTLLAETISKENKELDEDELNFVVQQTLDRIIFLRICEDRNIEPYGRLKECLNRGNFYENLLLEFKQADDKYNSGLFNFKIDKLSHQLKINNKTLRTIISQLYYPECPYEFSVLSVEILGSTYEQFLGKTITINNRGEAFIEIKPEVRKAGGVYYTPQYIVDYIVINTIGKLCEKKTPKEVAEMKIVDPACGSGSFLIGAYQFLLNWHKDYYIQNPNKKNPLTPEGNLTTPEKKKILLNNIFGVDIDTNAVEVTKLSLLLKCMEGETQASIAHQMKMFNERVLPTLDENIKSGNSLIDTDYYDTQLDFGEERKVKPFSWQKAYPTIFKNGGFDVVIGNPPYGADYGQEIKHYLSTKYSIPIPIADTFLMFIKQAYKISNPKSNISYIVPSTWLYMNQYSIFRETLIKDKIIDEIILFRQPVFANVTVETCIINLQNSAPSNNAEYNFKEVKEAPALFDYQLQKTKQLDLIHHNYSNLILGSKVVQKLFDKIGNDKKLLKEVALTVCGLTPYRLGKGRPNQTKDIVDNRKFDGDYKKDETFRQYIIGRDFNRYCFKIEKERWISYGDWLAEPRYKAPFNDNKKIVVRQTSDRLIANLDTNKYLSLKNVHNIKVLNDFSYEYLLALLNSKLLDWWYKKLIPETGRVFAEVKVVNLERLPVKSIDFKNTQETLFHTHIVNHVEQLLQLNNELQNLTLETRKEQIKQKIEYHEDKINDLVYQLYDLTEEEKLLIENN